jgi:hypothetical protein
MEKDIFDQFREQSEDFEQQPSIETWQKLEKRLTESRKRRPKRLALPTHWLVATITLVLLLGVGSVAWLVTREHEARLRGEQLFAELSFLQGRWSASEAQVMDELIFEKKTARILRGGKILKFKDTEIQIDSLIFQNIGKRNLLVFQNQTFEFKTLENQTFIFQTPNGAVAKLRRSEAERFTLSFEPGQVFVYRKME